MAERVNGQLVNRFRRAQADFHVLHLLPPEDTEYQVDVTEL
jgi:hypothetical protein